MPGKFENFVSGMVSGIPVGTGLYENYNRGKTRRESRGAIDAMVGEAIPADAGGPQRPVDPNAPQGAEQKRPYKTTAERKKYLNTITAPYRQAGDLAGAQQVVMGYLQEQGDKFVNHGWNAKTLLEQGDYEAAQAELQKAYSYRMDGMGIHTRVAPDGSGLQTVVYDEETGQPQAGLTVTPQWLHDSLYKLRGEDANIARATAILGGEQGQADLDKTKSETAKNLASARKLAAEADSELKSGGMKPLDLAKYKLQVFNAISKAAEGGLINSDMYQTATQDGMDVVGMVTSFAATDPTASNPPQDLGTFLQWYEQYPDEMRRAHKVGRTSDGSYFVVDQNDQVIKTPEGQAFRLGTY